MHGDNGILPIVEVIHWIALGVMGTVYTLRLIWLFKFPGTRDRQLPGEERGSTSIAVPLFSMGNVAMPWIMESTRKNLLFYASFVLFHLGVALGIILAFTNTFTALHQNTWVASLFMILMGMAFLVSIGRVVRRLVSPVLRLISTPDDYFSLLTLTVWFGLGVAAEAHLVGMLRSEIWLVAYLVATSFFLIYVPFSKISHYLYYPFTRYWLGRTLGHRGSMSVSRG